MNFPRNPLPVRGRIEQCWLFVYRAPVESIRHLLPASLAPVTHGGFAFWNVVVCRLRGMRPVPLPPALGIGYWHVAYRLQVQARTRAGTGLAGLYFLRSDCDSRAIATLGNMLTDFHFHVARIALTETTDQVSACIQSRSAAARFRIDRQATPALAPGSPFASLEAASTFLKYQPLALSPRGADQLNVLRVSRPEADWRSRLVSVPEAHWQFFAGREPTLELCFEVAPINYLWERGRVLPVQPCAS